tara:strand:- start:20 stop:628 length:609 start_codon:yes stop_codon:yes gene_type:complete
MLLNNIIFAFLLGSIPTGYLLVQIFGHGDIRKFGSGNIGATNVLRKSGKKLGLITLIIDFLKGFICCGSMGLGIFNLNFDYEYMLVGSAVILGHIFSPWLKFKGGKGVATALGVIAAILIQAADNIAYWSVLIIFSVWFFVFLYSQYVALASVFSLLSVVIISFFFFDNFFIFFVLIFILIAYKHKDNFERIKNNKEHKISF